MESNLRNLFVSFAGLEPVKMDLLPQSGSHRAYYRIVFENGSMIGVIGESAEENRAFCGFARHFLSKGINVPEVYAVSEDGMCYLQQDLGADSLFDVLAPSRRKGEYSESEIDLLRNTIRELVKCQKEGDKGLDYNLCIEEKEFSPRGIAFDLHYFKYCFLKPSGVVYKEYRLEDDFSSFATDLLKAKPCGFLYRDFQARNVMIHDGKPYFIDFQSGRKGPVFYDLASFVFQARSNYPADIKSDLISVFKEELRNYDSFSDEEFDENLNLFVLFRTLQVLAAYGFRGNFERKAHFLESIPFAISNLEKCLPFCEKYPYMQDVLSRLVAAYNTPKKALEGLTVEVSSFSYKKGIPTDSSGNGGGYVFDCRGHNNPGRYEEYKHLTALDEPVKEFLRENSSIDSWLESIYKTVDPHIETWLERGFNHLQISFGCTGGHHRSVYSAEAMARHIKARFTSVRVLLSHPESGVPQYEFTLE